MNTQIITPFAETEQTFNRMHGVPADQRIRGITALHLMHGYVQELLRIRTYDGPLPTGLQEQLEAEYATNREEARQAGVPLELVPANAGRLFG